MHLLLGLSFPHFNATVHGIVLEFKFLIVILVRCVVQPDINYCCTYNLTASLICPCIPHRYHETFVTSGHVIEG